MHKLPIAAALLVGLMVSAAGAAEPLTYDVTFNDQFLTAKTDGLSLGDRIIIDDALLKDGKNVGSTSGVCTMTNVQGIALCNITFVLPDGTLAIQFVNSPPPRKDFAILGGTGAYAGKIGAGVMIENGDNTGTVSFDLN
jgi:hypothetical protein